MGAFHCRANSCPFPELTRNRSFAARFETFDVFSQGGATRSHRVPVKSQLQYEYDPDDQWTARLDADGMLSIAMHVPHPDTDGVKHSQIAAFAGGVITGAMCNHSRRGRIVRCSWSSATMTRAGSSATPGALVGGINGYACLDRASRACNLGYGFALKLVDEEVTGDIDVPGELLVAIKPPLPPPPPLPSITAHFVGVWILVVPSSAGAHHHFNHPNLPSCRP